MLPKQFAENIPQSERSYADVVLCTALDIGDGLLKCGAEIQRVEDTIQRIGFAYGACHIEVFAITGMITAAIRMPDGDYSSQVRRVYSSSNDFRSLEDLNALSRRICEHPIDLDEVQKEIAAIKKHKGEGRVLSIFGGTIAAAGFAVFFGGGVFDAIVAGLIGLVMLILGATLLRKRGIFSYTLINSFLAGSLALLTARFVPALMVDKVNIATIMLLIPGSSFCNSLRDLFSGDTFAGSARLVQSLLLALTIASGYSLAILLFGGVL